MLYYQANDHLQFYCNGEMYQLSASKAVIDVIQTLCSQRRLSPSLLNACATIVPLEQLMLSLVNTRAILPEED